MSVYLSHPLIPENVYQAHHAMYARSRFGRDTHWDEMIEEYRPTLRKTWRLKSEKAGPTIGACLQ